MQDKRINAGYEIIQAVTIGNTEFVLGENIHDHARYVTWECDKGSNYFWGHYFTDKDAAHRDLYDRVEAEAAFRRNAAGYPKDKDSENTNQSKKRRDREAR